MTRATPCLLLLLAACTEPEAPGEPEMCTISETRSYDTAEDPSLYSEPDPGMGLSNQDVAEAMFGSFTGTYTPDGGDPFAVEVSMGVDGLIEVVDYTDCPSKWTATLVFAMSSEQVDGDWLIDDLWSPAFWLEDLEAGHLQGAKPAEDFDGALDASGEAAIEATYSGGTWSGALSFGGQRHGTFEVSRQR